MKSYQKFCLLFIAAVLFIFGFINFIFAISSPRSGAKIPQIVAEFLKEQQPLYQQSRLAKTMQQYRLVQETIVRSEQMTLAYVTALSYKVPVLVGKFSDSGSDQWKTSELEKEMFKGPWSTGTMTDFYKEISYNQFHLDGTVYGWYKASKKRDYYGNSVYGLPGKGGKSPEFIRELIAAADGSVDFSQFDNDGDGYVETIFIVHYGQGAEGYMTPSSHTNEIWSHKSKLSSYPKQGGAYKTNDKTSSGKDVYIDDYVIQPAISSDGKSMIEIGVFCHEYGHALGLPDLYDYDGSSEGIGHWGLMGSGGWNTPGSPAHMSAWSKIQLGWIIPVEVDHDMISATLLNAEQNPAAHKLWTYGSYSGKQYFLVENRQAVGFDKNLHNSGLLIWHVDESRSDNDTESHKMVDLEEADGNNDLDNAKYGNRGDNGDCYPGSTNNTVFDNSSNPNSRDYNSNNTHCEISNISGSATTMTADLIVGTAELKVDLVIKDGPNDNGNEPSPDYPWWAKSDIWIDNNSDGKADLPAKGMDNLLWARVFNFGTEDAANVKVKFYQSYPALGLLFPSKANFIDDDTISLIKKNKGSDKISVKWKIPTPPPKIDHYCIGVIAENDKDKPAQEKPRYENNLAQINYVYLVKKAGQVVPFGNALAATSPGFESIFIINNPRDAEWSYRIYIDPNSLQLPAGWTASVDPQFAHLLPGERAEGLLTVNVQHPRHGDSAFVDVVLEDDEYHTIEGGIRFACIVDDVPPLPPEGLYAHSFFDRRDIITPDDPTVRLDWPPLPEGIDHQPDEIVYYKIYRSNQASFQQSPAYLVDSTAIDAEPDEPGNQWYDTIDVSTGPYYYALSAVDGAGNESGLGNISPIQVPLFGNVMYFSDPPRPVPELQILLDETASTITDPGGFYEFINISAGNHILQPFRAEVEHKAIDDEDLTLILYHLAYLLDLNEFQHFAADVVPNEEISGADALAVARFLNNNPNYGGETGHWKFDPPLDEFNLVIEKMTNFMALVLGDVNTNWGSFISNKQDNVPDKAQVIQRNNSPAPGVVKSGASHVTPKLRNSGTTTISLPAELQLQTGTVVDIPIFVSTDSSIGLAQLVVQYDSTVLAFVDAFPAPGAPDFVRTAFNVTLPFSASADDVNKNVLVQFFGYGSHYFTGTERQVGALVFEVIGSGSNTSPLFFDRELNHTFLTTEHLFDLRGDELNFVDGNVVITGVSEQFNQNIPAAFALHQNYPNPFNPITTIQFEIPFTGKQMVRTELHIYNLQGEFIRTLINEEKKPGIYQVRWDGMDESGIKVATGIYLYQIRAGLFNATKKMILMK